RVFLFAAEPPTSFGLDHDRLLVGQRQRSLQRSMHVIGTLQRPDDLDPASCLRECDRALRLDIELLLESYFEGPLDYLDILHNLENLPNLAFNDFDLAVGLGR